MRISSPSIGEKMELVKCLWGVLEIPPPSHRLSQLANSKEIGQHTVRRNDSHPSTVQRNRPLNCSVALGLVQAVAARLVEGAEGVREEASNVVLATERVVLEDFVGSVLGAAADDAESRGKGC